MSERYPTDAELLAEVGSAPPLREYDRHVIRNLRAAVASGAAFVLGEVGPLVVWSRKGETWRCMGVADYSPGNPHPMWSQVRRWAREAGVMIPGLSTPTAPQGAEGEGC